MIDTLYQFAAASLIIALTALAVTICVCASAQLIAWTAREICKK